MLNSKTTSKDNLIITDLSFKLDSVLKKEWLDTNGLGGYSSSTIINCHTRKYHGMLVASLENPRGRFVLLSKLELSLLIEGKEFLLSTNILRKFPMNFIQPLLIKWKIQYLNVLL